MPEHVKVLFFTDPVDGYPPEEWESMWCRPLGENRFKLDNIPFFAKGVSCEDVIKARCSEGRYVFTEVVDASSNSTVRVIVYDLEGVEQIRGKLRELGCEVEGSGIEGLLSANVPKSCLGAVTEYLQGEHAADRLDYEEATMR